MNESEVKELVEQIAMLEDRARTYTANDAWYAACACTDVVDKLEKKLERDGGFVLGDSERDIIAYRADWFKTAQSVYLIFDTANWCWRQPEEMPPRRERQLRLNEDLARIAIRLHEIEMMESQADRRIRSADNVDTVLSKLSDFFGTGTITGQCLEEIRNAFVQCQFLKREEKPDEQESGQ